MIDLILIDDYGTIGKRHLRLDRGLQADVDIRVLRPWESVSIQLAETQGKTRVSA